MLPPQLCHDVDPGPSPRSPQSLGIRGAAAVHWRPRLRARPVIVGWRFCNGWCTCGGLLLVVRPAALRVGQDLIGRRQTHKRVGVAWHAARGVRVQLPGATPASLGWALLCRRTGWLDRRMGGWRDGRMKTRWKAGWRDEKVRGRKEVRGRRNIGSNERRLVGRKGEKRKEAKINKGYFAYCCKAYFASLHRIMLPAVPIDAHCSSMA
eukprot:365910-Chlamydomonas_euryale.AAC.4